MRHPLLVLGTLIVAIGLSLRAATAADVNPQAVRDAIRRGREYLEREQLRDGRSDGSWPEFVLAPFGGEPCGLTALCTLALLNAGTDPQDDHIQRALKYLRNFPPERTYSTSLQTMVFCRAEPKKDMQAIGRNVRWLEEHQMRREGSHGGWSYPGGSRADNSNSQFATLALYEAERVGATVSDKTWRLAKRYWEEQQNADGSWGYYKQASGTGAMTCAGLACLVITSDRIEATDAQADGDAIKCCQPGESGNKAVQRGLDWLAEHFSVDYNPAPVSPRLRAQGPSQMWLLYYLYGVERVGRLTAHRFIGKHDWYREGTNKLVAAMQGNALRDYWIGVGPDEGNPHIATSLALLFLSKGRWPVLISKLRHGPGDDWNQHRHDVGNLTRHVESHWRRDLVWQVVDLGGAGVDDLAQSPVLYLCGSNSPLPADEEAQQALASKFRDYLDRGGFLLAEPTCGGEAFDRGFRKLMKLAFPEPEYKLDLLPTSHPIWHTEVVVPADQQRMLMGIEYGCRTSVVYVAPDPGGGRPSLSCLWELSRSGREQRFSPAVRAQYDAGLAIGLNIISYATNQGDLRDREDTLPAAPGGVKADPLQRGRLMIANLRHPGGCSAAPRALSNLLQTAADQLKIRIQAEPREVGITDAALFDYYLVFMHGRSGFRLTEAERKQLRTFLQRGGTIFADAICASRPFAESFRNEMKAILPDTPLTPIPVKDPIWTATYGGFDLATVARHDPQPRTVTGPTKTLTRHVPPELEGIKLGNRYAVIFSPYDLSCALEKQDSMECRGYTRQDAARIGLNVVLYAMQQ